MADSITPDAVTQGNTKSYALSTTNQLYSTDPSLNGMTLYGSTYNRPFVPNRVTISTKTFPHVRVWRKGTSNTDSGSVTYYDPKTVPLNTNQYKMPKTLQQISTMPAWLSTLVAGLI